MLARLNDRYGVTRIPHQWFKSYLFERDQSVVIGKTVSESHSLIYGVPQGSVIGPTQFILYSGPVQDILKVHGINGMVYADDTQLYTVFEPSAQAEAIASIESCVADIRSCATSNKLKINDDKTEIVYIRSRVHQNRNIPSVKVGDSMIRPVDRVKDLGYTLTSTLRCLIILIMCVTWPSFLFGLLVNYASILIVQRQSALFTRSSHHVWTLATAFFMASLKLTLLSYNACTILRHAWSLVPNVAII